MTRNNSYHIISHGWSHIMSHFKLTAKCKQHTTKRPASNWQNVYVLCCLLLISILSMQTELGNADQTVNNELRKT